MAKPVNFVCRAPSAQHVFLSGDFNNWSSDSHPMTREPDGAWFIQVPLNHGHHRYVFLVDGERVLDPKATGVARNGRGEQVSLRAIS
jgi:1,4-alpha-glucan branching enzyme